MRSGFLALTVALAAIAFPAAAQGPVPGRDLQGVWLDNSATPLERPNALDGRQFLTDAEVVELKQRVIESSKPGIVISPLRIMSSWPRWQILANSKTALPAVPL